MVPEGDWSEHRRLILNELQRLTSDVGSIREKLDEFRQKDISDIKTEIALLKFKSSMWGMLSGGLCSILVTGGAILLRLVK